jgi:hypothetical protein
VPLFSERAMLQSLFGPGRAEILSKLGRELGGRYEKGRFFQSGKLRIPHRQWEITVDDYSVHAASVVLMFVRLRAPYVNRDGFRFRIYRKSGFSVIGKLFGIRDIEIGDPSFDDRFIIQGSPASMVTRLLNNQEIKDLMKPQRDIQLEVKDDEGWFGKRFPEGVDELCIRAAGTIYQTYLVCELFELMTKVLDELCAMGSADPINPFPGSV